MTETPFFAPRMDPQRGDDILRMLTTTVADDAEARAVQRKHRRTRGVLVLSMAAVVVVIAGGVAYGATRGHTAAAPGGHGGVAAPTSQPSSPASPVPSPTGTSGSVAPAGTPTATPVPTPTATAVPTPTLDLANPSSWVITFDGVGPLTIGGSQKAEAAKMTAFTVTENEDLGEGRTCPADFFQSSTGGPNIATTWYTAHPDVTTVISVQGGYSDPISPAKAQASPRTTAGIGIGSTKAEVLAAYPAVRAGVDLTIVRYYSVSDGAGRWLDFGINEQGQVSEIAIMDGPTPPYEYCG